jgi:hypothetical protein
VHLFRELLSGKLNLNTSERGSNEGKLESALRQRQLKSMGRLIFIILLGAEYVLSIVLLTPSMLFICGLSTPAKVTNGTRKVPLIIPTQII